MNIPSLLQFNFAQLVLLILIPISVSALLYWKDKDTSPNLRWILASLRFIAVFILVVLLFNWKWFGQQSVVVKPTIAVLVDDSESMKADSTAVFSFLTKDVANLQKAGYQVDVFNLGQNKLNLDTLTFTRKESPLISAMNQLVASYEKESHLFGLVNLSDGIVTSGMNDVTNQSFSVPVHSIAFGDTTVRNDMRVVSVITNKSVLIGNSFEISAQFASTGFSNKQVVIVLKKEGKVIQKKEWFITNRSDYFRLSFFEKAVEKGVSSYQIEILSPAEDKNKQNDSKSVLVDVVEGKKKVLILANSPHPDIRMFEAILASSEQFQVTTHVLSVSSNKSTLTKLTEESYEWIIAHQLPSSLTYSEDLISTFIKKGTPIFFVVGTQTSIPQFNKIQESLQIAVASSRADKVRGVLANGQESLLIDEEWAKLLPDFPAVLSPYGTFQIAPASQVILEQSIGTVKTNKPLLFIQTSGVTPLGFFVGDGLWQWRMASFQEKSEFSVFDAFWLKMFQLIEKKSESNQLRVRPTKEIFYQGEPVELFLETFNVLGEPISNQVVHIEIQNKQNFKKSYEAKSEVPATTFQQSGFNAALYTFQAEAILDGKKVKTAGYFEVSLVNKEAEMKEANHDLLRTLSVGSKGQFTINQNKDVLVKKLIEAVPAGKVITREEWIDTIDWAFLFFLLVISLSIEWGIRKYIGK